MKKYINKITLIVLSIIVFGCDDPTNAIYDVFDGQTYGAVLRTLERGDQNFNLFELDSRWDITIEEQDEEYGDLLTQVVVYVGYTDNKDDGVDNNKAEVVLATIPASAFTTSANGLPTTAISYTLGETVNALGLSSGEYNGGDIFNYRLELHLSDGRTFSAADGSGSLQGSYFDSPYAYNVGMLCIPATPFTGDYTIDMQDSYGDGWQTTTGNGGPGLSFIIDGVETQVSLCSDYEPSPFPCVANDTSGTAVVTVPAGTQTLEITFPGDFWGEISFQIYAPSGNLIADVAAGAGEGPVALNLCDE